MSAAAVRLIVGAGKASAAPPLGPALGQRGVNIMAFCKDFNAQTAHIKDGTMMRVKLLVKPDRTFEFAINNPTATSYLKGAAGIKKGSGLPGKKEGIIASLSLKHIYEIASAKIKNDSSCAHYPLDKFVKSIIASAYNLGIKVVDGRACSVANDKAAPTTTTTTTMTTTANFE